MVGGGRPLLPEMLKLTHPLKNADYQLIFAHSALAVTTSKKIQLTRIGNYRLSNEPKMNSLPCP